MMEKEVDRSVWAYFSIQAQCSLCEESLVVKCGLFSILVTHLQSVHDIFSDSPSVKVKSDAVEDWALEHKYGDGDTDVGYQETKQEEVYNNEEEDLVAVDPKEEIHEGSPEENEDYDEDYRPSTPVSITVKKTNCEGKGFDGATAQVECDKLKMDNFIQKSSSLWTCLHCNVDVTPLKRNITIKLRRHMYREHREKLSQYHQDVYLNDIKDNRPRKKAGKISIGEKHFVKKSSTKTSNLWNCQYCNVDLDCLLINEARRLLNHMYREHKDKLTQGEIDKKEKYQEIVRNRMVLDPDTGQLIPQTKLKARKGRKRHLCSFEGCNRGFPVKSLLDDHLLVHYAGKQYQCNVCGKSYVHKESLADHMNIHTGGGFVCSFCGKVCASNSNLQSHIRVHTGEKNFKCEVCGKCFGYKSKLKEHMVYHNEGPQFSCSSCDKLYPSQGQLNEHMRCHTDETPFQCKYCGNKYKHRIHSRHYKKCKAKLGIP